MMPHDPNEQTARNNTTAAVRCELKKGVVPCEILLCDRGECHVTPAHFARTNFGFGHVLIVLYLSFRLFEARSPVRVACKSRSTLQSSCAVMACGLACKTAGLIRA